jgi:hypothetical protein
MLDWQIVILEKNRQHPEGYDATKDGCFFPDWQYQTLLLPHFHTGAVIADKYDGAIFEGEQLEYLERNLQWALDCYEGLTNRSWYVVTTFDTSANQIERTNQEQFSGNVICALLEKTLRMIARAKSLNAAIAFFGD